MPETIEKKGKEEDPTIISFTHIAITNWFIWQELDGKKQNFIFQIPRVYKNPESMNFRHNTIGVYDNGPFDKQWLTMSFWNTNNKPGFHDTESF